MPKKPTYEELESQFKELKREMVLRKQAYTNLNENHERLESALKGSDLGTWDWDLINDRYTLDKNAQDLLEHIPDNLEDWIRQNHPADWERVREQEKSIIEGENEFIDYDYRLILKSGEIRWILSKGRVIEWDKNGKPKKATGILRDITKTKRIEEDLANSHERLELALKGADAGMWEWNITNDSFILDSRSKELIGYVPGGSDEWFTRIHPDDLEKVKENDEAVMNSQTEVFNNYYRYALEIGKSIWVHCKGRVVEWNVDGKPIRASGTMQDITQNKEAEEALQESERNLKRAQRISKIGSWLYNQSDNTVVWSDECFKMYGLKKDDFPGNIILRSLVLRIYANPEETSHLFDYLAEKKDVFDYEFTTTPINGDVKIMHTYCEVERGNDGGVSKIFGTDHDITERKQMENHLIKVKEQAEVANKMKSEFLSNISHELRTPMQAINGFSNLAIKRFETTKRAKLLEYFSSIHTSGRRLLSLLNDLLDLSSMESGTITYHFKSSKISEVILNAIKVLEPLAKEKKIDIDFQQPKFADTVIIDQEKITQVIINLLSNAIKFSIPETSIRIEIDRRNEGLSLSIIDKGIGIPESELEFVFDKFVQSSKTRTNAGGTGLGLAICKNIISDHKGKIWAEKNRQGGATFRFVLPFEQNNE